MVAAIAPTLEFAGAARKLAGGDIEAAAASLGCKPAAIHMFLDVETASSGFQTNGRPRLLFEAHVFGRLTGHKWDRQYPNISAPGWNPALYGAGGDHQYTRLEFAIALDRPAALEAASWGLGQVMSENYRMVGFADVESFVAAMMESERRQLDAMLAYLRSAKLIPYLQRDPPDFVALAGGYNGRGQIPRYAGSLAAAWRKWDSDAPETPAAVARATAPAAWHTALNTHAAPVVDIKVNRAVAPPAGASADADAEALNRAELAALPKDGD